MSLILSKVGEEVTIKKITGNAETKKFLNSLGFIIGEGITIVSDLGGNLIVNIIKSHINVIMTTLKDVKCGQTVRVKKIQGEGPVRRRIMDMGITKGSEIYVRKVAPLGDPVEINIRGYELTLRKFDAEMVIVE